MRKKYILQILTSGTVSILVDTLIQPGTSAPANARPREDWTQTIVPVSRGSEGFDVSPDNRELWTASAEDGMISIVDLKAKKLRQKLTQRFSALID